MSYFPQKPKTSVETKQTQPASETYEELERLRIENARLQRRLKEIEALIQPIAAARGQLQRIERLATAAVSA